MRRTYAIYETLIERRHSPSDFFSVLERASAVDAGLRVTYMKPLCQAPFSAERLSARYIQEDCLPD